MQGKLKAIDKKWEALAYTLATEAGTRLLDINPHFQKISDGWFDTGKDTISEGGKASGTIYVDRYTGRKPQWDGGKDEFSDQQILAIVDHIAFQDIAHLPDCF